MAQLRYFNDTHILMVFTGIEGSSKLETAARTSGYGDSLDLLSAKPNENWVKDVLDFFVFGKLQFGG